MINIGLYLASEPHGGGAHQYNLSIISALELFDKTKYRVSVYCHDTNWLDIVPKDFSLIIVKKPFILKVLSRLYKLIDNSAEGLRRHASFFNPLVKKINESDCEIVICPNQDALSYQCNKKTVTTIHDLMHRYENHFDEYRNGEIKRRDKHYTMICKYANCILVDSIVGRNHVYESYKIEHDRVFVLPFVAPSYLTNNKTIDVKKKYKLPDNYIFYPAQFWEHKNHIRLLEAITILKNKNLDINLVLVGSKKNVYNKVEKKIHELCLTDRVFILGYVNNEDMASLYKSAKATVFVSLIGPTNIPPLEAIAIGSPLICSNVYAMPEQVGDSALLIDPKSSEDIAEKIYLLLTSSNLSQSLVQKGLDRSKNYGLEQFKIKLYNYIESLLICKT